ncbi:MAG: NTP transferase domain-containing protein [Actinomycetia bacterium]|nr:NTP transferase domain-containing protein [Actinomycetes bacterium]
MGCLKPLIEMEGVPLIAHTLSVALAAGASPVVLVLGREARSIRAAVQRVFPDSNIGSAAVGGGTATPRPHLNTTANSAADRSSNIAAKHPNLYFTENPEFAQTDMLCSIRIGLLALLELEQSHTQPLDGFFLIPGDMPAVRACTYRSLWSAAEQSAALVVQPEFEGRTGHPLLVKRQCFTEILATAVVPAPSAGGGEHELPSSQNEGHAALLTAPPPAGLRAILQRYDSLRVPTDDPGILLDADVPTDIQTIAEHIKGNPLQCTGNQQPEQANAPRNSPQERS